MSAPGDDSSVKVAIRIRPQLAREHLEGSRVRQKQYPFSVIYPIILL